MTIQSGTAQPLSSVLNGLFAAQPVPEIVQQNPPAAAIETTKGYPKGFVMPTKEDVETYDALIALQYSGLHFRSQMKNLAKRSRNKAVGRVLQTKPQRITVFMDALNNPGIKSDGKEVFTVYPKGILWSEQDPEGLCEWTLVRLIKEIIGYTDAQWENGGYMYRGYNTKFGTMNIKADNIDERVFTESGILQHSPRPQLKGSLNNVATFEIVQQGEHWKGGTYYNRTAEDKIVQDHAGCEICELGKKLSALLSKEAVDTDKYMVSQGGGSLAIARWFPFAADADMKKVPTLITRGTKVMKKA